MFESEKQALLYQNSNSSQPGMAQRRTTGRALPYEARNLAFYSNAILQSTNTYIIIENVIQMKEPESI
jgi:hypothetical protein